MLLRVKERWRRLKDKVGILIHNGTIPRIEVTEEEHDATVVEGAENAESAKTYTHLTIVSVDPLLRDSLIRQVICMVHIVNTTSGRYMKKMPFNKAKVVNMVEKVCSMKGVESDCAYILPISTMPIAVDGGELVQEMIDFSQNEHGTLYIDQPLDLFKERKDCIFFFELLAFGPSITEKEMKETGGYHRVAWAFLKPWSVYHKQTNLIETDSKGNLRLQLYEYPKSLSMNLLRRYAVLQGYGDIYDEIPTPDIYLVYLYYWNNKKLFKNKYHSSLYCNFKDVPRPDKAKRIGKRALNVFEYEEHTDLSNLKTPAHNRLMTTTMKKEQSVYEKRRLLRLRKDEEVCEIPDDLIKSVHSDSMGCTCLKYSNDGEYIACACINYNKQCTVKIFELSQFKNIIKIQSHYNYIYTIFWSNDDKFIITASADCSIGIFYIDIENKKCIPFQFTSEPPSYVYCANPFPMENNTLHIVASYFDKTVKEYMFKVDTNAANTAEMLSQPEIFTLPSNENNEECFTTYIEYVFMNGLVANDTIISNPTKSLSKTKTKILMGDSKGYIIIYSTELLLSQLSMNDGHILQYFNMERIIKPNGPYSCISYIEYCPKKKHYFLSCGQMNVLKKYSIIASEQQLSFPGFKCENFLLKASWSPDGRYFIAGSEDRTIDIWDTQTSQKVHLPTLLDDLYPGVITDIKWHPTEHMLCVSCYGGDYPILFYVFEMTEERKEQRRQDRLALDARIQSLKLKHTVQGGSLSRGVSRQIDFDKYEDTLNKPTNSNNPLTSSTSPQSSLPNYIIPPGPPPRGIPMPVLSPTDNDNYHPMPQVNDLKERKHPNELNPNKPKNLPPPGVSLYGGPRMDSLPRGPQQIPMSSRNKNFSGSGSMSLEESLSNFSMKYKKFNK